MSTYLQDWLTVLRIKQNRRWIVEAASQAEKASEFFLGSMC
ncbi:MAG: hypothetical protein QNL68_20360 [Akkermansiaceae bacterium]